jgi:hypothetical protein
MSKSEDVTKCSGIYVVHQGLDAQEPEADIQLYRCIR